MDFELINAAIISYLAGFVLVHAYFHRNRYLDLVLASFAVFSYATGLFFRGIGMVQFAWHIPLLIGEGLAIFAVVFLMMRVLSTVYSALKNQFGLR